VATLRLYFYGSFLASPEPLRSWGMRHVMNEVWHDYFLDPRTAPDPDPAWLAGCSPRAMIRTDRALSRAATGALASLSSFSRPVLVLYGEDDIFGSSEAIVQRRFPAATQVTLGGSGHLHWLQNPAAYRESLRSFYAPGRPLTV
jgi:pimeloyl-ACP methyl ester carboxylesterase